MSSTQEPGRRILIVEDDFGIRDAMTQILGDEGYTVVGAGNGLEALSYLRAAQSPPALILLDLTLPVINGWQFMNAHKEDPKLAPIPVVVMSADSAIQQKVASMGATSYLQKPVEITLLLDTVERYCQ
jgi:CheY-like chemotaxis protein